MALTRRMPSFARSRSLALLSCLVVTLGTTSPGEGLTQISFSGAISAVGGAHVEVEVSAHTTVGEQELQEASLFMHMANGTSAADVANLVADRLSRLGIDIVSPGRAPDASVASLFVARTKRVRLRLGHGLAGSVSLCEEAPLRVGLERPGQEQSAATLNIGLSAYYMHTSQHRRALLTLDVPADATVPWVSEQLANRGIDVGWNCVRPDLEGWRVNSLLDGGRVTGVSIELESAADWALVVELDDGEG